jgi:hypothetical protein
MDAIYTSKYLIQKHIKVAYSSGTTKHGCMQSPIIGNRPVLPQVRLRLSSRTVRAMPLDRKQVQ